MANRSVLTGRLVADPELRLTQNENVPVASFRIAVPRRFKKDVTDFIDIVAWRKEAEFVCQYFSKGKWIEVDGFIQSRPYTDKEGKKRTAIEVVADSLSFVGDKPKGEASPASNPPAPPPIGAPTGFDPFANAAPPPSKLQSGQPAPAYASDSAGDFAEFDEDGDLPF